VNCNETAPGALKQFQETRSPVMKSLCKMLPGAALLLAIACGAGAQSAGKPGRGIIGANGPKPGSAAPDFELKTMQGKPVKASDLWKEKPTVVMTGCLTCPVFRGKVSSFQGLVQEFGSRVNFLVVYTIEAHPKGDPSPYSGKEWSTPANEKEGLLIPQPKTMDERITRVKKTLEVTRISAPLVVDTMDNKVWKAYGSAPNCAYVIGTDGKIAAAEPWMEPSQLRRAIERQLAAK
jgi:cytochrome oxidase Cu insertion factor (SCO1/SenC/PrrC family)